MNAVPILTKEELETPRTAADMLAWVDSAHARFDTKELKAEARKGAEIRADESVQEHEGIVAKHLKLVEEAVRRKAKKKYEPNTALIVVIDNSVPFREQADVNRLNDLATQTLVPALHGTNFSMLVLAGSNHVHLIYRL